MKNKIIGLLIFLFFFIAGITLEHGSVANFFLISDILLVLGTTSGLLIMYYKKDMDKNKLLKKAKQYFIFSGYFSVLISAIIILLTFSVNELTSFERMIRVSSVGLLGILYGYAFAYITDTFIDD